jgi:Endosomal/lysosomal potassium channel TMEM175
VDAVVAIAITLLVLPLVDIAAQLSHGGSVSRLLGDHLPQLYGLLLSLAVIAPLWFAQHHVISTLVVQDPPGQPADGGSAAVDRGAAVPDGAGRRVSHSTRRPAMGRMGR